MNDRTDRREPPAAATTPAEQRSVPARNAEEGAHRRPLSDRQSGPEPGEDPAAGSIDHPVAPGEAQAGDMNEQASNLGGPVDVFPLRDRRRKERPAG